MSAKSQSRRRMAAKRLPVPFSTSTPKNFVDNETDSADVKTGKVRVFAHERGQWSLHVFAHLSNELFCDIEPFITNFENVKLCSDIHLSLNRGYFVTRHHQISSIVDSLSKKLCAIPSFIVCLSHAKILENEDNTRLFVCLCDNSPEISTHRKIFNLIMESVYSVFSEFATQMKHCEDEEAFVIHASLAWCLPKFRSEAVSLMNCINQALEEPIVMEIKEINTKIGNKSFTFKLKDV